MKNLKKSKVNKELRAQKLNKVAGGCMASYVECPKCKRTYILTCCDDRCCPYCRYSGR